MSYLDFLPEEIHTLIYRIIFDDCLEELMVSHTRKWIERFMCSSCKPETIDDDTPLDMFRYPQQFPFACPCCHVRMCVYCYIRNLTRSRLENVPVYGLCRRCASCIETM